MHSVSRIYSGIFQEIFKEAANYVEPVIRNSNGIVPEYTYACIFCYDYSNLRGVINLNCNPHNKVLFSLSRTAIVL
jgi:hypothetical protein